MKGLQNPAPGSGQIFYILNKCPVMAGRAYLDLLQQWVTEIPGTAIGPYKPGQDATLRAHELAGSPGRNGQVIDRQPAPHGQKAHYIPKGRHTMTVGTTDHSTIWTGLGRIFLNEWIYHIKGLFELLRPYKYLGQ